MSAKRAIALASILSALSGFGTGCAKVTHRPLASLKAKDDTGSGIRYFRSAPYLLVHSDGKGGIEWKIVFLPDQTQPMSAEPTTFLASIDATLKFKNGVLTSSDQIGDATAVPKALIKAAQTVATAAAGAALSAAGVPSDAEPGIPAPYLYKIVVRDDSVVFYGGQANAPEIIRVSL